jgi:hypothetical protein
MCAIVVRACTGFGETRACCAEAVSQYAVVIATANAHAAALVESLRPQHFDFSMRMIASLPLSGLGDP